MKCVATLVNICVVAVATCSPGSEIHQQQVLNLLSQIVRNSANALQVKAESIPILLHKINSNFIA